MKFLPKLSRNSIVIWFCILIPVLFAIQFMQAKNPISKSESYTSFLSRLEKAQFKEVVFLKDGRVIRGVLKSPIDSAAVKYTAVQTDLPVWNSDIIFAKVEAAKVPIRAIPNIETPLSVLVKLIPTLILLGFVIYIIRSSSSPTRVSSMFNKTSNKLVKEVPKITFADVAGADEAKQELQEMVDFLKSPGDITSLGGTIPKGALLIGPPGTGKTLLARAVAGEAQRPFFSMSGSDFVEMFVGVGASRVRGLFEAAKPHAPCIIFIDEIDAVGRTRGTGTGGGSDEREQTLNQLLVEMDGFTPSVGIIVLAATNRPDVLDSALLRPGRFDRQVNIDLPDIKGREAILAVHAKRHPMSSDIILRQIARGTPGFSGADLANLLNEAALFGARNGRKEISLADLEAAKDKMILGLERRSMVLSPAERSLTAFHEAGHAIVNLITVGADPLHKVTIIPRGRALGVTASLPDVDRHTYSRRWLMDHLVMLFGGRAAEEIVLGKDGITTGAQNDIERATDIARRYVTSFGMSERVGMMNVPEAAPEGHLAGSTRAVASEKTRELIDDEVRSLLSDAYTSAMTLLNQHKKSLNALAQGLLDKETLSGHEILTLLPDLAALPHHEASAPLLPPPPLLTA